MRSINTILIPGLDFEEEFTIDTYYNTLIESVVELQDEIAELTLKLADSKVIFAAEDHKAEYPESL